MKLPGKPRFSDPDDAPDQKTVTPGYFATIDIPLLAGRSFTDADTAPGAEPVIILSDVAAQRYLPGEDPIGRTIESNGSRRIVGVVRAVRLGGPEAPLRPEVYTPMSSVRSFGGTLYVRTSRDPGAMANEVRGAVRSVLNDVVVPEAQTLDGLYEKLIAQRRFNMIVLALFGALGLVIAGAGIYGVMAYLVEQRTQEIGIRMALGADAARILRMVLGRATWLLSAGLALGLGAGWLCARLVSGFLFAVTPHALPVYAVAAAVLALAGLTAALVPAWRASRVDPVRVLR